MVRQMDKQIYTKTVVKEALIADCVCCFIDIFFHFLLNDKLKIN